MSKLSNANPEMWLRVWPKWVKLDRAKQEFLKQDHQVYCTAAREIGRFVPDFLTFVDWWCRTLDDLGPTARLERTVTVPKEIHQAIRTALTPTKSVQGSHQ